MIHPMHAQCYVRGEALIGYWTVDRHQPLVVASGNQGRSIDPFASSVTLFVITAW
ncbi:hypothetical protein [Dyella psychrodurans]|uniref:hypothetical protein n=1 Tax=Dyella psychrodurans TaxID=1927960 RepID=UPI0013147A47|nr:hypothetical protein [Dyella psychrodurans]